LSRQVGQTVERFDMKKIFILLLIFVLSFPIIYVDDNGAMYPQPILVSKDEVKNEVEQIQNFKIKAPDFSSHAEWFNIPVPLSINALRGNVVVINFWRIDKESIRLHQNINILAKKYRYLPVKFIDVQSPVFYIHLNYYDVDDAIRKYKITHPLIFDSFEQISQAFNVQSTPAFVLVDQQGYIAGYINGINNVSIVDTYIAALLEKPGKMRKLRL